MKTSAIILQNYPEDYPSRQNAKLINLQLNPCSTGNILIRSLYLSVDPYMRNRLRPTGTNYLEPLCLGKPIVSMGIGEVIESKTSNFNTGDLVIGMIPWQEFAVIDANGMKHIRQTCLPITTQLGILGYPGLTAYVGICHIAKPKPGQTIFISSAAGAVGSLAGQLAKLSDCYVVGCASSDEKVDHLVTELGYDTAFNYLQHQKNLKSTLQHYCPQGIDIDFENVGGNILEAVIECLNPHSTIVLCGAISQYNSQFPRRGPKNFHKLTQKEAKLVGYIVTDFEHIFDEFQQNIIQFYQKGKISYHETIVNGFENAWDAFIGLFEGKNIGKMLVAI